MVTLVIDSATKVLYEALIIDSKVVAEHYINGQNDHAKNIVKTIEDMLNENHLEVSDINKIVCGIGPGSYTGVRMAVTVAKMFGAFKNIPVYKISTLALMASGAKGKVLAKIDARRHNAFCAVYENGKLICDERLRDIQEFEESVKVDSIVDEAHFVVDPILCSKISVLHEAVHSLEPNYLQETEAERNLHHEA